MKVRRNPTHKAQSCSLLAPRKAEWRLPSRAVVPPVSYQVDTLAFGVKHTPEMGCYALQTSRSVPVIFIGNTVDPNDSSEDAMTRDESCFRGGNRCAPTDFAILSSGYPPELSYLPAVIRRRRPVAAEYGIIVHPHIVLLMPLAISTIKKMVMHYRNNF